MPGAPSWARSASPATPPTTTRPAPSPASRPPAIAPTPAEPPRVRLEPARQETPRTRDPVQGAPIASERKAVSGRLRPDEFRTQAVIDRSAVAGLWLSALRVVEGVVGRWLVLRAVAHQIGHDHPKDRKSVV